MKKSISLILLISIAFNAFSGNTDFNERFKKGNQLYTSGQYEDAVKIYNELTDSKYESPELYFNLANCYYRLNNVGLSIYWYKKAELLSPGDDDIKYNLDLANLRVQNLPPVLPENAISAFYYQLVLAFPIQVWGIASMVFFLTFLGLFFLNIKSNTSRRKKSAFIFSLAALLISLITIFFTGSSHSKLNAKDKAVVMTEQINLKSAPNTNGINLFPVYEGFYANIESTSGKFVEIKLTDGRKGWIMSENLKEL
jgi:tetratricopeptide (TPR) repeat protein